MNPVCKVHDALARRFAFGLTRFACQTAIYKKSKNPKIREKLPRKEVRTSQTKELII